ncbi:MAG: hypothetical protein ACYDA0_00700 [Candidatus Dormibacteraceae bacterium]
MAEQTFGDLDGGESEPGELKELVEHWVHVIDRWVQRIDQGMGGTADVADPAMTPDTAPEMAPDQRALEAG